MVITRCILDYVLPATWKLQSKDLDIAKSVDIISNLKSSIQNLRASVDEYNSKCYNDALNLAEKVDIKESNIKKPRFCSRQTYRSNQLVETTKNYFKMALNIPFLDHVLTDLQHRFHRNGLVPYRGLYLIPYLMFQEPDNSKELFIVFENFYLDDFANFTSLAWELHLCYNFWDEIKYKNDLPNSISATPKRVDPLVFPNIYLAVKLLGTLPITPWECERSSLRSTKTWDRSTITNWRLYGLALLFIHSGIDLTVSEIIVEK